jgi:hypothetical protein
VRSPIALPTTLKEYAMNKSYTPTRPLLRTVFVIVALVATFSTGVFIDGLAQHHSKPGQQAAYPATVLAAAPLR